MANSCPGHARVMENDQADGLAGKPTVTSGLHLGRSEVFWSFRHYQPAQSQGNHTIDCLEEIGIEKGSGRQYTMKRKCKTGLLPNAVNHHLLTQSDQPWHCFKGNVGETSEMG